MHVCLIRIYIVQRLTMICKIRKKKPSAMYVKLYSFLKFVLQICCKIYINDIKPAIARLSGSGISHQERKKKKVNESLVPNAWLAKTGKRNTEKIAQVCQNISTKRKTILRILYSRQVDTSCLKNLFLTPDFHFTFWPFCPNYRLDID